MPSSGMLHRVALVRTDVSEECRSVKELQGVTSQKTAILNSIMFFLNSYFYIFRPIYCADLRVYLFLLDFTFSFFDSIILFHTLILQTCHLGSVYY
jgi:hypothetical protein